MSKFMPAAAATAIFGIALVVIYWLHVRFVRVDVVFYGAIADAVLASAVGALALVAIRYFRVFNSFERLLLVTIWLLLGYCFAISVPTVIDRSLSFYILEKLQQRGGSIPLADFERVFTREYVKEHHLVAVRITEQVESGTVEVGADGCVRLTVRGDRLARFSRFFRRNLLPRQRLLMGRYTDVLTDPFRDGRPPASSSCGASSR